MRLEQPDDLPRAARHLERDPVGRQQTVSQRLDPSRVDGTRPAENTLPSSQIAISMKSRCTSSPTHRPNGRDSNRLSTTHLP